MGVVVLVRPWAARLEPALPGASDGGGPGPPPSLAPGNAGSTRAAHGRTRTTAPIQPHAQTWPGFASSKRTAAHRKAGKRAQTVRRPAAKQKTRPPSRTIRTAVARAKTPNSPCERIARPPTAPPTPPAPRHTDRRRCNGSAPRADGLVFRHRSTGPTPGFVQPPPNRRHPDTNPETRPGPSACPSGNQTAPAQTA